jgi:hypothetical protein
VALQRLYNGAKMDAGTWNVLHDGRITSADGLVPGDLRLTVDIGYLCDWLPTSGKVLMLYLRGCQKFEYHPFERSPLMVPAEVAAAGLEILRAACDDDTMIIEVADGSYGGRLRVKYLTAEIETLEQKRLSQEELETASDQYWDAWSRRTASLADNPAQ